MCAGDRPFICPVPQSPTRCVVCAGDRPFICPVPQSPTGCVACAGDCPFICPVPQSPTRCVARAGERPFICPVPQSPTRCVACAGERPFICRVPQSPTGCVACAGERPFICPVPQSPTRCVACAGERPFICPVPQSPTRCVACAGERPFICPFEGCDRSFTTSNIRKVHIRTHTGERPYICTEEGCGKAFASATNYKNHIRIHTGTPSASLHAVSAWYAIVPSYARVLNQSLLLLKRRFRESVSLAISVGVCRCQLLSLLFHFGVRIITATTFVGAGSARITFQMHCAAESASSCSNHSFATNRAHYQHHRRVVCPFNIGSNINRVLALTYESVSAPF